MGWMRRVQTTAVIPPASPTKASLSHTSALHVEDTSNLDSYRPVPTSVTNEELPFIPSSVVSASATSRRHWLVIDNIIYDCTEFITEHPGGPDVLKPFRGHDCTWQFKRFHGKGDLEQGWGLRVGRTSGVRNKFEERHRFVGLRGLGADYW